MTPKNFNFPNFVCTSEVSKLYFKCSKNSISLNVRAPKYPFFNEELKILGGRPINLVQEASTSELRKNQWNNFKCSNNSISWNIRAPKYPFFNEKLKFLVQNYHTLFLKQSILEASEALKKWEGMILKKTIG